MRQSGGRVAVEWGSGSGRVGWGVLRLRRGSMGSEGSFGCQGIVVGSSANGAEASWMADMADVDVDSVLVANMVPDAVPDAAQ